MTEIERALHQSFDDEYTRLTNGNISTSETENVSRVFKGITMKMECIICYDENTKCIKCFQCTATYCKACLVKIASEFNKCVCGINVKQNYNKLHTYNTDLQKTKKTGNTNTINNAINNRLNNITISTTNTNNRTPPSRPPAPPQRTNVIVETNYRDTVPARPPPPIIPPTIPPRNINTNINTNTNTNTNTNSNSKKTQNSYDFKAVFKSDLINNKIYNIDFKTYIDNDNSANTPNFTYYWNHDNKTLIFTPSCNQNRDLQCIIITYYILDAKFQAELYPWLLHLLNKPVNIFKNRWNTLASKINNFKSANENELNKLRSDVINLCSN